MEPESTGEIPIIYVTGGHFDIGLQVGKSFKGNIHEAITKHSTLGSQLVPFYNTPKGKTAYDQLLSAAEAHLPQYVQEIKGIAAGADAEFYKLFLMHIEADLAALMIEESGSNSATPINEGCSDFIVKNQGWALHVHSEDSDASTRYLGCIWMADIDASEANGHKAEKFISFAYPGMIPGSAWTVNSHGLMLTGNILSQKQVFTPGMIPRRTLGRAVMNEKSLDEFIKRLETTHIIASAFNFMVSQRVCDGSSPECVQMASIEIVGKAAGNKVKMEPASEFQYHFNEFQWMSEAFHPDLSSIAREKRLEEFKKEWAADPYTLENIKAIMSDEKDKEFPYFRDGAPPDYLATANIAIADRYIDELSIYKLKPVDNDPSVVFDIRPWTESGQSTKSRIIKKKH